MNLTSVSYWVKYLLRTPQSTLRKITDYTCCFLLLFLTACSEDKHIPDQITYTEHIAPIIYNNCTYCHRANGSAHFAIENYAQARNYANAIAYAVQERLMPPWPADPSYTEFAGQRVLSDRDIQLIEKWASCGAPEGPKDKLPPLPDYPAGSMIGTPDVRLPLKTYLLPANSSDHFLLVKVPFELPEEKYASVIEFVPGRGNVVHHVNGDMVRYEFNKKQNVFEGLTVTNMILDSTIVKAYKKLGLPNDDGSYPELQKSVVNYLPGVTAQKYPEGIGGYLLPRKGAFLLDDMHYGPTTKEVLDSSYINIFFAKTPPRRPVREFQIGTLGIAPVVPDLVIAPNTEKRVYSECRIPEDISILTVNPHMHLLGKSFKAYAITPAGDTIRLISIPRWNFNWQYFYTFKKMVKIPAGSLLRAEGVYDNTKANFNNPYVPPRLIKDNNGSMRSTDEMFQFIITYLPYESGDEQISLETS